MKTLSPDTSTKAEQFHIELIRKAPIFRRLQMVNSLIKKTRLLSWQGICDRYPEERPEERIRRFISLLYRDDALARRIQNLIIEKNLMR